MHDRRTTTDLALTVLTALTLVTIVAFIAGAGLVLAQDDDGEELAQPEGQAARVPAVVPAEARKRTNPIPADERSIDSGKLLYSSQCVMCHGKQGAGDGDLVGRLNLLMPDLTDPVSSKERTDGEWFYILSEGHGVMPGQLKRFDEQTRWDIVNYIRTLSKGDIPL